MCMLHNHGSEHEQHDRASRQSAVKWYKSSVGLALLGLAVLLGYYLWVYHGQHVLTFLPIMFLFACPLMHLLMHRNHGHGDQAQPVKLEIVDHRRR